MAERWPVVPELLAERTASAPRRLLRKLDRQPDVADKWLWEGVSVTTDKGETVSLSLDQGRVTHATCTCLLSPRCLHVLGVLRALPVADETAEVAPTVEEAPARAVVSESQKEAAVLAFDAAAAVLERGALASGAWVQGEVLRAVHAARSSGLHAVGKAGVRVVQGIRALRTRAASADPRQLADDVHALLAGSVRVQAGEVEALGVARRRYVPIQGLRLYGMACEPVVSATGHAGVVTWLCDADGGVYSVPDLYPAGPERARGAYGAGIGVGDVQATHAAVSRTGLWVAAGTVSPDGRLGRGAATQVAQAGAHDWTSGPVSVLFDRALELQVSEAFERPDRHLLFVRGTVLGCDGDGLVLECPGGRMVRAVAPLASGRAGARTLKHFGRLVGQPLWAVGRLHGMQERTLRVLALRPVTGVRLPGALAGQVHPGLDGVQRAFFDGPPGPVVSMVRAPDVLQPMRQLLHAMLLGGRGPLLTGRGDLGRACARLARVQLQTGAGLLQSLSDAAHDPARDLRGGHVPASATRLARAWLQCHAWVRAVERRLRVDAWSGAE